MSKLKGRPLHERVIVRIIPTSEMTQGGLYLPMEAREVSTHGVVESFGPLVNKEGTNLSVGDKVLFIRHSGFPISIDGVDYQMILANDIIFVYDQEKLDHEQPHDDAVGDQP